MIRVLFWALVAIDVLGVGLLFLLGLAAAGSTRSNPLQVALLLLVLPCIPLVVAILLFVKTSSPGLRILALFIAATPMLLLVSARAVAEWQVRAYSNAEGKLMFFRGGPMRELAEAIARNDTTAVAALLKTVDVNRTGFSGVSPLILAMRQLRETPERQEVLRLILDAGAEPNKSAQYELPLSIAIELDDKTGPGPVKLLLDKGADPNLTENVGEPVFFLATGQSARLETLTMLIDRGANVNAVARNGHTALFSAANSRNWKAVLLLLQRGANPELGRSVNGLPFRNLVDGLTGAEGGDSAYVEVRRYLQQR